MKILRIYPVIGLSGTSSTSGKVCILTRASLSETLFSSLCKSLPYKILLSMATREDVFGCHFIN